MNVKISVLIGAALISYATFIQAQPFGPNSSQFPSPYGYHPRTGLTPIDGFDVPRFYGLPHGWWTQGCSFSCWPVVTWVSVEGHQDGGWMHKFMQCDTFGCPGSSPW